MSGWADHNRAQGAVMNHSFAVTLFENDVDHSTSFGWQDMA
jgi:hypothetical protein